MCRTLLLCCNCFSLSPRGPQILSLERKPRTDTVIGHLIAGSRSTHTWMRHRGRFLCASSTLPQWSQEFLEIWDGRRRSTLQGRRWRCVCCWIRVRVRVFRVRRDSQAVTQVDRAPRKSSYEAIAPSQCAQLLYQNYAHTIYFCYG